MTPNRKNFQPESSTLGRAATLAIAAGLALAIVPTAAADHSDAEFEEGCAVTPGGWGSQPSGNNPGSVLHDHFTDVFGAGGFTVGSETFETAQEVTDEIPRTGGAPLFNHAVALTINLAFGNAGLLDGSLSGVVADGADYGDFTGLTAEELLDAANAELANPTLSNDERSNLIDAMTALNEEREGCNPVPPSDLVCVALENGVNRLTWTYLGDMADLFNVYRRAAGQEDFTLIGTSPTTSFDDTSAVPETTYEYFVTAFDADTQTESSASNVCEITAIPFFPTLVGTTLAMVGATLGIVIGRRRTRAH